MKSFHFVLAIAWMGVACLAIGTCYQQAHAGTLRASSATFWPVAQFSVSGIPVTGTPTQAVQPDGSVLISQNVPSLTLPAAISLRVLAGDGTAYQAVLPGGLPGPLIQWGSPACRADIVSDGAVGLSDVSAVFGLAAQGASCP